MKIPEPWIISVDRTDWKFGKTVFNVLTLGLVHHGVAFPFVSVFVIRKNTLLDDGQKELRADVCFQDFQVGQSKVLSKPRKVWNHWLRIAAMRLEDGGDRKKWARNRMK